MPDLWYYGKNEQHGPVPLKELKKLISSGSLETTDLVWSPGMADWTAASEVGGLFSESRLEVVSPPPAVTSPSSDEAAGHTEDRWHYEYQGDRRGPVLFDELQNLATAGHIHLDSLVWKRGMADWTPAGQVDGLFPPRSEPSVEPADLWYYGDGEQRNGPVSMKDLANFAASGQIQSDSLVWKPGMADWIPAGKVDGLFALQPEPSVEPPDLWYYGDGEQRHGPVSLHDLRRLALAGQLQPSDLVWRQGMAEWAAAADVDGLLPAGPATCSLPEVSSSPPIPTPSLQERVQKIREAAAPHVTRAATATRTNLEWFWKFLRRQHLGTRLRLLITAVARWAVWCYNAIRPHVVRVWSKRPSKQEVQDWSAARAQQATEAWKRTAPQRSRFAQGISVGLSHLRRGLEYCWKATGRFSVWFRGKVKGLGVGAANTLQNLKAKVEAEAAKAKAEAEAATARAAADVAKARAAAESEAKAKAEAAKAQADAEVARAKVEAEATKARREADRAKADAETARAKAEAETQSKIEADKAKAEAAEAKADAVKARAAAEVARAEAAKVKVEADKAKTEAEVAKAEAEKAKAETEAAAKAQAEAEAVKARAEAETKSKSEADKAKAKAARAKAEAEAKADAEAEAVRAKAEAEAAKAQAEAEVARARAEADKAKTEAAEAKAAAEKARAEAEKVKVEAEAAKARIPKPEPVVSPISVPSPKPEQVTAATRIPPPMPKPVDPAVRVPPPMPKPASATPRVPPPMPKPVHAPAATPAAKPDLKPPTPTTAAPTSAESQSVHQPKGD